MRRFERRHVGAIPAGGTFGLKLNEISSVPLKRRVQSAIFAKPTILLPDRLTSRTPDFESVYGGANLFASTSVAHVAQRRGNRFKSG
jgi:hypothetical protein